MSGDRQDFDGLCWDTSDEEWQVAQKQLRSSAFCRRLEALVTQKFSQSCKFFQLIVGGYNVLYRMRFEGELKSPDVMVRLPCPAWIKFPEEKTLREVATARYITLNTNIPVPKIFCSGYRPSGSQDHDHENAVGAFIILEYIENKSTMSHALRDPTDDLSSPHMLDPNLSATTVQAHYRRAARVLLQLAQHTFPRIGSLVENDAGSFFISGRPSTQNMNSMIQLGGIPRGVLPVEDQTYQTADEWYLALADMHLAQLVFQHNDLVTSVDDCRNKYVARQLFRRLAKQGHLSTFGFADDDWSAQSKSKPPRLCHSPDGGSSFRLWCDDFRPSNILLNASGEVTAVIDWEFAYAAPTQFLLDPPWWLLLDVPEMWDTGIDEWRRFFEIRLETWLAAMKQAEEELGGDSRFTLSEHMRESWGMGRFWLNYAARKSWAFDTIFWQYLDERFFGTRRHVSEGRLWEARTQLLTDAEREAMEPFVRKKMEDARERILVDWDAEHARSRLSEFIFD